MKLLLTFAATGDEIARIRFGLPAGWEVVAPEGHGMTRFEVRHEDVAHLCEGVDAIMAWVVPPRTWDAVPDLKALAWLHAGCDELDFEMLRRRGVAVCNIRGGNAITVAEQAMTLMLGLARRVVQRHLWVQEARWQPTWHPDFMGVALEGRSLAIIGLGINGAAYVGEIYRAGIEAIHRGQLEAALSVGMTPAKAMRYIVLPQAIRIVLPPLCNYAILLVKDTAIISSIAAPEIMFEARRLVQETFESNLIYLLCALIYLAITIPMSRLVQHLERAKDAWK